jgi:hypothetical protein
MKVNSLWLKLGVVPVVMMGCMHSKIQPADDDIIPVVTISVFSPTEGSVLSINDSVSIKAQAISNAPLHGYDLIIKQANDTTTYLFTHLHDHEGDTINIDQKWKGSLQGPANLEAVLTVYLDHELHTKSGKVQFRIE